MIGWKTRGNIFKPKISCKLMTKILCGNFEWSNIVFLVQFGINSHLWVLQKAEIALTKAAQSIPAFRKTHFCKLIPNWTPNRMITHSNRTCSIPVSISLAHKSNWDIDYSFEPIAIPSLHSISSSFQVYAILTITKYHAEAVPVVFISIFLMTFQLQHFISFWRKNLRYIIGHVKLWFATIWIRKDLILTNFWI